MIADDTDAKTGDGTYALHKAVWRRDVDKLKELLDCQSKDSELDFNERDCHGNAPLHLAIHFRYRDIVHLLLDRGADPTFKNGSMWSPLQEAVASGDRKLVMDIMLAVKDHVNDEFEKRTPHLTTALQKVSELPPPTSLFFSPSSSCSSPPPSCSDVWPLLLFTVTPQRSFPTSTWRYTGSSRAGCPSSRASVPGTPTRCVYHHRTTRTHARTHTTLALYSSLVIASQVWKRGASIRVDTTLVGFENMKWMRGNISILFKGEDGTKIDTFPS